MATFDTNIKRPRYFDRQQLRAEDLSLEQAYQDRRSRQLNQHLHGWGVVCGALIDGLQNTNIDLGEGFAVTPNGDTLTIPAINNFDLLPLLQAACGEAAPSCESAIDSLTDTATNSLIDTSIGSFTGTTGVTDNVTSDEITDNHNSVYLVAKPASSGADPRTGIPEDCGHPGNQLEFSRICESVCLSIVCDLSPVHQTQSPQCEHLRRLLCSELRVPGELDKLLREQTACPPEVSDADNYVVIARLILMPLTITAGLTIVGINYDERRLLLPTQQIQEYLSCLCNNPMPTPAPTLTPTATFTLSPTPTYTLTPTPVFTVTPSSIFTITPSTIFTVTPSTIFTVTPPVTGFPGGLTPPVTFIGGALTNPLDPLTMPVDPFVLDGIDVLVFDTVLGKKTSIDELILLSDTHKEILHEKGIDNVLDLYASDTTEIAATLGKSEVQVAEYKDNALESMRRAEVIALDEAEFDVSNAIAMPVEDVHDIGRVRGETLSRAGYASVADIANTSPEVLVEVLSISEPHANELIADARNKARRL